MKICIFWHRRDLRFHDNAGLAAALASGLPVVPLFIYDSDILEYLPNKADARLTFIHDEVEKLAAAAESAGGTFLARYGRPVLDLAKGPGADAVGAPTSQQAAGALLGRYLVHSGHRRVSFVACAALPSNAERLQGLREALANASLSLAVHHASQATAQGGAAVASAVLLAAQRPDAVVAANDPLAMGLLSEARVLGVAVPGEVSVAGMENAPFGRYLSPALTSVELHADELGARAMSRLLAAVRGQPEPPAAPLPEPQLVLRESTRARSG